jgi:hypothetical protein
LQEEEQGHTEATASEEARCEGTRTIKRGRDWFVVTNDVPGCPNGGLLSGTDGRDELDGKKGNDEIHGLGGSDSIFGGAGNDVIYGGPGNDVVYGGDGNDFLDGTRDPQQRDKLYCGEGRDVYRADKNDYVDSSCEKKARGGPVVF